MAGLAGLGLSMNLDLLVGVLDGRSAMYSFMRYRYALKVLFRLLMGEHAGGERTDEFGSVR